MFARDVQALSAGGHNLQSWAPKHELFSDAGCRFHHVLAVVEDQQSPFESKVIFQGLNDWKRPPSADPDGSADCLWQQLRCGNGREIDEPDAVWKGLELFI